MPATNCIQTDKQVMYQAKTSTIMPPVRARVYHNGIKTMHENITRARLISGFRILNIDFIMT